MVKLGRIRSNVFRRKFIPVGLAVRNIDGFHGWLRPSNVRLPILPIIFGDSRLDRVEDLNIRLGWWWKRSN